MNTSMERARERMAEHLSAHGIKTLTAWPGGERGRVEEPVAVVSLRSCRSEEGGFGRYLGERFDEDAGMWDEVYGRRADLTFGLDLYAPARGDGADLQQLWDRVAAALTAEEPEGLHLLSFSCGETEYDAAARLRKRKGEAVCRAWLYTVLREDALFTDFILRGGWNT